MLQVLAGCGGCRQSSWLGSAKVCRVSRARTPHFGRLAAVGVLALGPGFPVVRMPHSMYLSGRAAESVDSSPAASADEHRSGCLRASEAAKCPLSPAARSVVAPGFGVSVVAALPQATAEREYERRVSLTCPDSARDTDSSAREARKAAQSRKPGPPRHLSPCGTPAPATISKSVHDRYR